MISDQSCPLCGEKMNLFKGTVICSNKKCGLRDVISIDSLKDMESQIARIKQEAKQEFWKEIMTCKTDCCGCNNLQLDLNELAEVKKKHGVE